MPTYYGTSVDTRVALGDSDAGPYHTERRDHATSAARGAGRENFSATTPTGQSEQQERQGKQERNREERRTLSVQLESPT